MNSLSLSLSPSLSLTHTGRSLSLAPSLIPSLPSSFPPSLPLLSPSASAPPPSLSRARARRLPPPHKQIDIIKSKVQSGAEGTLSEIAKQTLKEKGLMIFLDRSLSVRVPRLFFSQAIQFTVVDYLLTNVWGKK